MVGPRSTGCRKCVQRRVKCDETKPQCNKCLRNGYECPGYDAQIRFIPTFIPGRKSLLECQECIAKNAKCDRKRPKCTRCARQELHCVVPDSNETQTSPEASINVKSSPVPDNTADQLIARVVFDLPGRSKPEIIPLSPSIYNEDVYCGFFLARFFSFGNYNEDTQYNRAWMWQALQAPTTHSSSSLAVRALVTGFFANVNHDDALRREGLILHGEAMAMVTKSMSLDPNNLSFDVLSAIALLSTCETCYNTGRGSWRAHVRVLQTLFPLKGPDAFRNSREFRALLTLIRPMLISEALISRRRTFLEDKEWDGTMTSEEPDTKWVIKLGDIMIFLPGIIEDIEILMKNRTVLDPEVVASESQRLYDRLLKILDDLRWWWNQWSSAASRLPVRVVPEADPTGAILNHFPLEPPPAMPGQTARTIFRFPNLDSCSGYCRYHGFVIQTLHWVNTLLEFNPSLDIGSLPPESSSPHSSHSSPGKLVSPLIHDRQIPLSPPPASSLPLASPGADAQTRPKVDPACFLAHALCIVEAVPTYCLKQFRHVGAVYMMMPVRLAHAVLHQMPDRIGTKYIQWLTDMVEVMSLESGFALPRFALRDDFHGPNAKALSVKCY